MNKTKIDYLKNLYNEENDRQKVAETKCSQIISSTGIFLTLIGLIITLLINSTGTLPLLFKGTLVVLVVAIIVLYVTSMKYALNGLSPKRYGYSKGDPLTVNKFDKEDSFDEEVINDYLFSIKHNSTLNTQKFNYLIRSTAAFVWGIYLTAFMVLMLVIYIGIFYLGPKPQVQRIQIVKVPTDHSIKQIASSIDSLSSIKYKIIRDTIFIPLK